MRLDGSQPVRYGLKLEVDQKYRALLSSLSRMAGIRKSNLLLVEMHGAMIRVSLCKSMCIISSHDLCMNMHIHVHVFSPEYTCCIDMVLLLSPVFRAFLPIQRRSGPSWEGGCMHLRSLTLHHLPPFAPSPSSPRPPLTLSHPLLIT